MGLPSDSHRNLLRVRVKYYVGVLIAMAAASSRTAPRITCTVCGKAFSTQVEMENHNRLEHVQHKSPAGVS